ncbi:MAG TPA: aminoacyl-tRNA hydrolase [Mycobacteriales bacterium]|jgi:PTH1 family peptidyl-tRNA hydrolase|nr:aminoacyl-tRNA hydrolase [Mycobacteriales bacterium]
MLRWRRNREGSATVPDSGPWLVIGLGNPGPQYAGNRHNAGFMVLDVLADRVGVRFKSHKARGEVVETRLAGERAVLAKPRSYMNESGGPAASLRDFFKTPIERIIVVHDELDLEAGTLRLKQGGGDNGHNGLKSLRRSLGSGEFYRVRLGVGRPPGRQDPAAFVLRDYSAAERKELGVQLERAADAIETLISDGLAAAQNAFND